MQNVAHKTNSPWISELKYEREVKALADDLITQVVIIGGGIAGMATAFFVLRGTDKNVVMLDAGQIGHGATGHNAGQVVDYFEKFFSEIVAEYGLEMAAKGQAAVTSGWDLLDLIIKESGIDINFASFTGYAGCTNLKQIEAHLENEFLKKLGGIEFHKLKIADDFDELHKVAKKYDGLYDIVPRNEILQNLETHNNKYVGLLQSRKGCLNSALFVEKLERYLFVKYGNRFTLYENTKVNQIFLSEHKALLKTETNVIACENVVLCTNGFENIEILDQEKGQKVNANYHDMIYSIIGYMAGYVADSEHEPTAISYFPHKATAVSDDPYIYVTRRKHKQDGAERDLICIGGPENIVEHEGFSYSGALDYPKSAHENIVSFLEQNFKHKQAERKDFDYKWHGLMGYTPSGIRVIGHEELNKVLLYNLGCNGVGILPSIYGGKKIADHLAGQSVEPSIFDPGVQRRVIQSTDNNLKP